MIEGPKPWHAKDPKEKLNAKTARATFDAMPQGPVARQSIEEQFAATLSQLSPQERKIFLEYADTYSGLELDALHDFAGTYGLLGIKTFISIGHYERDFADVIVGFGNRQSEVGHQYLAEVLFGHFKLLIGQTNDLAEYIDQNFGIVAEKKILLQVAEQIGARAARFLRDSLQHFLKVEKDVSDSVGEILSAIERAEENAVLYASVFRGLVEQAKEAGERFDPRILEGYQTFSTQELATDPELVDELRRILRENYEKHYSNDAFKEAVYGYFENALTNANTTFHILKDAGRVVGFLRFEKRFNEKGELEDVYFGSVNIDGLFSGGTIGENLFAAVLEEYKKLGVPIRADCDPESVPTQKIYFPAGFVQEGEKYLLEGQPSIKIVLLPQESSPTDAQK